jgi:ribosomal protein S12 methylthiotransferase accessory factor YcaO
VLDVTNDLGISTFVAMAHWMDEGRESMEFGSGAHFDSRIALLRALTELNQFLSIGVMGGGKSDKSTLDGISPLRLENYPYLTPNSDSLRQSDLGAEFGHLDTREQVLTCVDIARRANLDFLVADLDRERKTMMRLWAKREEQIRGVVESTAGLYGDLQGIAGRTLLEIEGLEIPLLDGPAGTEAAE